MGSIIHKVRNTGRNLGLIKGAAIAGLRLRRVPLFASLEVTRRCNGLCQYCHSVASATDDLPAATWTAIIDDLAASGTRVVSFTGGEPLLRKDLPRLVDHAVARNIEVKLNTNGMLLPAALPRLRGLSSISLSVDGVREVNDAIRGRGAFDAAVDGMSAARAHGVPFKIFTVLSRDNLDRLPEFLEFISERHALTQFQPIYNLYLRQHVEVNPRQPEPAAMRRAIDLIVSAKRRGYPVQNSLAGLAYLRRWPGPAPITCGGGRFFVRITATGDMEICGLQGDTTPGGIRAQDGVMRGMERLGVTGCATCWCAARLELNLALGLDARAARYVLSYIWSQ